MTFFRLQGISGGINTIYVKQMGFRVPNYNHPLAVRNPPSDRSVEVTSPITEVKFQTGERFEIYGFTGFDQDDWTNQRTYIRNFIVDKKSVTATIGTCKLPP